MQSSQDQCYAASAGAQQPSGLRRRTVWQAVLLSVGIALLLWGGSFATEAFTVIRTTSSVGANAPADGRLRHALAEHDWNQIAEIIREVPYGRLFDPSFLAQTCPLPPLVILGILTLAYLLLRLPAAQRLEQLVLYGVSGVMVRSAASARSGCAKFPEQPSGRWVAIGLVVVIAGLCIVERIESCYFVQSDTFITEFPGILQGCRSIAAGEFPNLNPCQLMGTPSAGAGLYSLLYPPMFLSYAIARWGLRNEYLTIEVFAALHLLAGYLASFATARAMGMRPVLAFVLGISFVLSGYFLFQGRSVHTVIPNFVWLPLLVLAGHRWIEDRAGWPWLLGTSVVVAAYYYVGFPQFWFYGLFLVAVAAGTAMVCRRIPARRLLGPVTAWLLGLAMILPLLIVQLEITRGMATKSSNAGTNLSEGLLATVLPYPLSPLLQAQCYYAGTVLIACCYLGFGALIVYRWNRDWLGRNPWVISALLAVWLGLGKAGGLWSVFGALPVIRTTNHYPHRLFPFFLFFGLVTGGMFLERVLGNSLSRRREYCLAAMVTVLMLYNASLSRDAIFRFADRPYPAMAPEVADRVLSSDDRTASRVWYCGPPFSRLPRFANTLWAGIASAYGAYSFNGYDPIGEFRPETRSARQRLRDSPVEACRAYGIRWVLVPNPDYYHGELEIMAAACPYFVDQGLPGQAEQICKSAPSVLRQEEMTLYEVADTSPMAFDEAHAKLALPVRFHGQGADIEVPGLGVRTIIVNMLARPWLYASGGGRPLSLGADPWGRLKILVPDEVDHVEVRCRMGWRRGIALGGGLAVVTLAAYLLCLKKLMPGRRPTGSGEKESSAGIP